MDNFNFKEFQASELPQLSTTKLKPQSRLRMLWKLTAFVGLVYLLYPTLRSIVPKDLFSGHGCHRGAHSLKSGGLPTHYTLLSGDKIPSVQLGVWKSAPNEVGNAVKAAIENGYEGIDDAWIYRNENEVGDALKESSIDRSDIWITSKLWNAFHSPEDVEPALDMTLEALQTDYIDLYLMHWPVAFKKDQTGPDGKPVIDYEMTADPYPTWQAMEALVDKGKVRNIGVSNFNMHRLENLTGNPLKYQPAVNQVELNFWNPQPELLKWSKERNLLLEGYSPLGSDNQVKESLSVPEVKQAAEELGMTPAQVIISWHVQRGTVVLPKSVHANRVAENIRVQKLPQGTFDAIEAAATAHEPMRVVNPSQGWGLKFDVFDENI